MFQNGFLVVCRELSDGGSCGEVNIFSQENTNVKVKYTENLREAIGLQLGMLVGAPVEACLATVNQDTVDKIVKNLNEIGRDRIANGEGECFIFVMFGQK